MRRRLGLSPGTWFLHRWQTSDDAAVKVVCAEDEGEGLDRIDRAQGPERGPESDKHLPLDHGDGVFAREACTHDTERAGAKVVEDMI